jgi:hypothetical protein
MESRKRGKLISQREIKSLNIGDEDILKIKKPNRLIESQKELVLPIEVSSSDDETTEPFFESEDETTESFFERDIEFHICLEKPRECLSFIFNNYPDIFYNFIEETDIRKRLPVKESLFYQGFGNTLESPTRLFPLNVQSLQKKEFSQPIYSSPPPLPLSVPPPPPPLPPLFVPPPSPPPNLKLSKPRSEKKSTKPPPLSLIQEIEQRKELRHIEPSDTPKKTQEQVSNEFQRELLLRAQKHNEKAKYTKEKLGNIKSLAKYREKPKILQDLEVERTLKKVVAPVKKRNCGDDADYNEDRNRCICRNPKLHYTSYDGKCVDCREENKYYDWFEETCKPCPYGYVYSNPLRKCVKDEWANYRNDPCEDNSKIRDENYNCVDPQCYDDEEFDYMLYKCVPKK